MRKPSGQNKRITIGVLAGWQFYRTATNLSYLAPVFRGVSKAAQDLGCNLLLGCGIGPSASPTDPMRPAWPVPLPEADFVPIGPWNTDGLLVANPLHTQARSEYIQELIASEHPILFIGSGEKGPTIVADNAGGIHEAMRHLYEHGHRQVAFIAGSLEDMDGDSGDRLSAYRSFLESHALDADPLRIAYGRHVYDGGYSAMKQIMQSGVPFTAVLASNDESALGAMQALEEAGLKIPGDVAMIGFDNRLEGAVHEPALSSIHVPLFDMGYHALQQLYEHIEKQTELPVTFKVGTRLVERASCGCKPGGDSFPNKNNLNSSELKKMMLDITLSQAHSLTEEDVRVCCEQLVDSFAFSVQQNDPSKFQSALHDVLQRTATGEDDAHIWQKAISLLEYGFFVDSDLKAKEYLNAARLMISSAMQQQHRNYVLDERWTSSRLSLLTDRLLDALEEDQIYQILAEHLPDFHIQTALLAMFDADESDPVAYSSIRNMIRLDQAPVRFPTREFPPAGILDEDQPFVLTLIPLVAYSGRLGFMVFGSEPLDLYGAIVQQLGGAFNTARLYRQAVEDRQLAEEANRMKSRFLSTISHELRTPLNLIVGLSGILLKENEEGNSPLPDAAQRDVERIQAYAQHLGGLIGDVLDLATSDAGRLRLNRDFIDLGDALRIVSESGRQLAEDKGLSWKAYLPEGSAWVWGDSTRLRQVALNLVNNAIKFTDSGEVRLRMESSDGQVTVSVSDTGLGIPLEEQSTIFNEFDRSERSIQLGYRGLGLGLAICKRLVEMHGGSIGVSSTGQEGAGSTFYFSLPLVQPPIEDANLQKEIFANLKTAVVVTDHPDADSRLLDQLRQYRFQVQVTSIDPSTAWQPALIELLPDAILLDVNLASVQSWEVLKAIKDTPAGKKIPVLLYESNANERSVLELEYLTKPVEVDALTQMLDQQLMGDAADRPHRTILVVDDEPNTLDMHARIVQSHSDLNRVSKAQNGYEALEILEREKVDLVMLDLQMPEMDGFELLERMRENERLRKIPVIVLTGRILSESDMRRLHQGVTTILEKGLFSIDETVAHIDAVLERKRRIGGDAQKLVRKAMAFIHEHYAESISRREIAQHVSIAEDYLTFCFRQELGTTPIKYMQRYRINQAKYLLLNTEKNITEIALGVGFSDSGYFSRVFHRETGTSPDAFRRTGDRPA